MREVAAEMRVIFAEYVRESGEGISLTIHGATCGIVLLLGFNFTLVSGVCLAQMLMRGQNPFLSGRKRNTRSGVRDSPHFNKSQDPTAKLPLIYTHAYMARETAERNAKS